MICLLQKLVPSYECVNIGKPSQSDHELNEVMLSAQFLAYRENCSDCDMEIRFKNLNFQKAKSDAISMEVSQVLSTQLFDEGPFQGFSHIFTPITLQI